MTEDRFRTLVSEMSKQRVVVVGDVMLDRYVEGSVDRISPEAPVPIVLVEREWDAVGGAGNVAANVTAWGAHCTLVATVGQDSNGEDLESRLLEIGVVPRFAVSDDRPTTVKTRVLAQGQQVVRVDRETNDPVGLETQTQTAHLAAEALTGAGTLILEDYNKGVLTPSVIQEVLDAGRQHNVFSLVDPKWENFFEYRGATVFKPNAKELAGAMGESVQPRDPAWMSKARERTGCPHLLLTLGADGMVLASEGGGLNSVDALNRGVFDVSGAGDTVSAAFALAVVSGASFDEALLLSTHAAGVCVGKSGVVPTQPDEVWESLAQM